jgi:hypothetical protein
MNFIYFQSKSNAKYTATGTLYILQLKLLGDCSRIYKLFMTRQEKSDLLMQVAA